MPEATVKRYQILRSGDLGSLEDEVCEAMLERWKPIGGITILEKSGFPPRYYQPMTRYVAPPDTCQTTHEGPRKRPHEPLPLSNF